MYSVCRLSRAARATSLSLLTRIGSELGARLCVRLTRRVRYDFVHDNCAAARRRRARGVAAGPGAPPRAVAMVRLDQATCTRPIAPVRPAVGRSSRAARPGRSIANVTPCAMPCYLTSISDAGRAVRAIWGKYLPNV